MALTIVTGSDNAGYGHKSEIGRASCRERV